MSPLVFVTIGSIVLLPQSLASIQDLPLQKPFFIFIVVATVLLVNYLALDLLVVSIVHFNHVLSVCSSESEPICLVS